MYKHIDLDTWSVWKRNNVEAKMITTDVRREIVSLLWNVYKYKKISTVGGRTTAVSTPNITAITFQTQNGKLKM